MLAQTSQIEANRSMVAFCLRNLACLPIFIYGVFREKYLQILETFYNRMPKQAKTSKQGRPAALPLPIPEGSYLIERILDLKIDHGLRYYLIKWQGYDDPSDNTWEPLTNLEYLLQDLIDFEESHASHIRSIEEHWNALYRQREVTEPLQIFDHAKIQQELDRLNEDLSSLTPDSESTPPKKVKENKQKRIYKRREASHNSKSKRSESHINSEAEQTSSKAKTDKQPPKKRGRKPYKQIAMPKLQQVRSTPEQNLSSINHPEPPAKQHSNIEQTIKRQVNTPSEESSSNSNPFPKRIFQKKGITSEENDNKLINQLQDQKDEADSIAPNEGESEVRHEPQQHQQQPLQLLQQYQQQQQQHQQHQQHQQQQQLQQQQQEADGSKQDSSNIDFLVPHDNSVADVLSRRIQSPNQPESPTASEIKRDSIFKNATIMRYNNEIRNNAYSSLHAAKKYVIFRKRKNSSHSERSDSYRNYHNNNPIMEVEEEQKESTPLPSNRLNNYKEQQKQQQLNNQSHHQSYHQQLDQQQQQDEQLMNSQAENDFVPVDSSSHHSQLHEIEKIVPQEVEEEEGEIIEFDQGEDNAYPNTIEIDSSQHMHQDDQEEKSSPKRILNNDPLPRHNQLPSQIDKINTLLDAFQKKETACIELSDKEDHPLPKFNQPQVNLINLDEDSSEHSKSGSEERGIRSRSMPAEQSKSYFHPQKTKKIKKEFREPQRAPQEETGKRGIVGRSQEALLMQEGKLVYRPSLNTLLQSTLTSHELRLLANPKIIRIICHFSMENVIVFTVQAHLHEEEEMRFISYQTLRDHFPLHLLHYLEQKALIEL